MNGKKNWQIAVALGVVSKHMNANVQMANGGGYLSLQQGQGDTLGSR
jgi:hypothetical protein